MTIAREADLVPTLAGSSYTDADVFQLEKRRIFERSWMCVGHGSEVASAGRYLRAEVGDESVLIVRGRDGALRAFLNMCRHRGTRLCVEGSGTLPKSIRCIYHGWTYGLDGRLIAAPNMKDMPDLVKADYGLHPVAVTEWIGYVWVNLDPQASPLAEQVQPQLLARLGSLDTLDRYGIADLEVGATITYDVQANWKALVENFTECYHCSTLHPELTAALPDFASGYGTISGGVGHGAALAENMRGFSLSGNASRPPLPGLLPGDHRLFHGIILLPNAFLILVDDHVAVFRLEPQAPERTRVLVDWLFDADVMAADGFDPSDAVDMLDLVNRQDFDACERCQQGMRSRRFEGVLVPAEHLITGFHDYLRAAMDASAGSSG